MHAIPFRAFLSLCAPLCGAVFREASPVRFPPRQFRRAAAPGGARSYASSRRRISRTFAVSSSVAGSMGGAQKGASPTPRSSIAFLITGTN